MTTDTDSGTVGDAWEIVALYRRGGLEAVARALADREAAARADERKKVLAEQAEHITRSAQKP